MGVSVDLLPLTTMMGPSTLTTVTQEVCESIDTSKYSTGVVTARSVHSSSIDFIVEGSDDGQTFVSLLTIAAGTVGRTTPVYLNRSEAFGSSTTRRADDPGPGGCEPP
ncbi:MAG: hypothetical protein FJ109_14110 [Deltaproteobacteria bacterium]|nr:hypothetical protein [Deltaproteobacteria bacterium]